MAGMTVGCPRGAASNVAESVPVMEKTGTGDKRLDKACRQMEAIFLQYMLSQMRKTVIHEGIIGHSSAMRLYQDLYDQQLSRQLSRQKSLGLAEMIKSQLSQAQRAGEENLENIAKVSGKGVDRRNGGPARLEGSRRQSKQGPKKEAF